MGPQQQFGPGAPGFEVLVVGVNLVMGLWSLLLLGGGIQMMRLRGFAMAMTGSVAALLPCNPCCLLGLPFGIWALVILNNPEVRDAFS